MVEMYVKHRHSAGELAIICGVSRSTILRWMKKHGIEKRFGDGMKVSDYKEIERFDRFIGKILIFLAGMILLIVLNFPDELIMLYMFAFLTIWIYRRFLR